MPSTVIRHIDYDPERTRMVILFQSGRRYAYTDVPLEVYLAFRAAPSRGAYFNERIRDCYPYSELEVGGS